MYKSSSRSAGVFCALTLVALAPAGHATVLAPNGSTTVYSDFNPGNFGAVLADTGVDAFIGTNFGGATTFQGNFRQIVVRDTGTGFLDFLYQLQRTDGVGLDAIARLSTTDFQAFTTDVGICTLCADLIAPIGPTKFAPGSIDRSSNGGTVGFQFAPVAEITANNETFVLVIKTNALGFTNAGSSVIDGGTANVFSYGPATPIVIPEPATAGLVALAGGGLLLARRFRARHSR